jgi:hypothetical protein
MSKLKAVKKADEVDRIEAAKQLIQEEETRADAAFADEYRVLCKKHQREIQPITNLVIRRFQE